MNKKIIRYSLWAIVLAVIVFAAVFCNRSFPIITGYCSKSMCSEVFLAARDPATISREDLGFFPISLAACTVNRDDSSVTATIMGGWKQRSIFRQGLGSTLVHDINEDSLRKQGQVFYTWRPADNDSTDWPLGDRLSAEWPAGINHQQLDTAVADFFKEEDPAALKNTRALLVVFNGQIIAEQYAKGFNKNSLFLGWSMGKSIGGALMGILQRQGLVAVQDPLGLQLWKQSPGDKRSLITARNVLQQASGIGFEEQYAKSSDVTVMLYRTADMGNFTAAHQLTSTPGSFFNYSSGNANLLSLKMRELLGDQVYHQFPYKALFNKIGMRHTLFEMDGSGAFIMSSYIYAPARDWARFGLLYLNKGVFNGEQLLDSSWVDASAQPAATNNFNHYGYQLWLNRGNDTAGVYRAFPHAPDDMVYAGGFQGQNVFIIPSRKLVVVHLGLAAKPDYRADHSLALLLQAVP